MAGASHPVLEGLPRWLLDSLGEGVSVADAEGRIVFSNKAADRILGLPATDRTADEWTDYYGVYMPDGRTRFPPEHYPLVRALRGESTNEVEMVVRNRAQPWEVRIAATGRPLLDRTGAVVGATVVFRDVTALSRAQVALARANEELRRVRKLEDELATFVLHDLNGPMTGILALTEVLLEECREHEGLSGVVVDLRELALSLNGIVADLLDLRVAQDGMLRPGRAAVPVGPLLREVCAAASPRAALEGLRVEVAPEPDAQLRVSADADLLRRTLLNLVDNGVKYAPEGGVIRLSARPGAPKKVVLEVSDEGPGVPPELRERIFDKYARLERDGEAPSRRSRGLGLSFCRIVTEAQGGRVWVEDGESVGSRFCVELRAVEKPPEPAKTGG